MGSESADSKNDRVFCWEQVARINRAFRISQVFASRQCAERLLPVYALFSAVEQICSTISDEDIARSKLNWWRSECLQNRPAGSRHPLVKELHKTGALEVLRWDSFAQLLAGAESRLDARAPPDVDALKDLCIELQRPQLDLEIAVCEFKGSASEFEPGLLARSGLLQLIRESSRRNGQGGFWWIPLKLLARHGVSREDIAGDPRSRAVADLLAEVFSASNSWGGRTVGRPTGSAVDFSPARHWYTINGLYGKKLKRLQVLTPDLFAAELGRLGPADLLEAWKCARRLQR